MVLRPVTIHQLVPRARTMRRLTLLGFLIGALATSATLAVPAPTQATTVRHVPSYIDASGSRDVSSQLQTFIRNIPNGSTIVFKAGGTYRLGRAIRVANKTGLTFEGNGATLKLTGGGNYWGSGILVDQGARNTTIRNLKIVGNHDAAGTSKACCGREGQHGIGVHGSFNTLIQRVDIRRVGGDCFDIKDWNGNRVLSDGITIRDSACRLTGRMGVLINGAKNVRIVNNTFDDIGYAVFAMEPNKSYQGSSGVVISNNWVGRYSLTGNYKGALFYTCDAPWGGGSVVRDVTVSGNTVAGNPNGKDGKMLGLNVVVCNNGTRRNFTVTNNTASQPVAGPVMQFNGVGGLTIIGNSQPLRSGSLASIRNSWGVSYRP